MTREQRVLTRELCHLGVGERGLVQKEIVVCDAEIHGHRPAMALGLPGTVFSLAQKLPLNQRFSNSLLVWADHMAAAEQDGKAEASGSPGKLEGLLPMGTKSS